MQRWRTAAPSSCSARLSPRATQTARGASSSQRQARHPLPQLVGRKRGRGGGGGETETERESLVNAAVLGLLRPRVSSTSLPQRRKNIEKGKKRTLPMSFTLGLPPFHPSAQQILAAASDTSHFLLSFPHLKYPSRLRSSPKQGGRVNPLHLPAPASRLPTRTLHPVSPAKGFTRRVRGFLSRHPGCTSEHGSGTISPPTCV